METCLKDNFNKKSEKQVPTPTVSKTFFSGLKNIHVFIAFYRSSKFPSQCRHPNIPAVSKLKEIDEDIVEERCKLCRIISDCREMSGSKTLTSEEVSID